MRRIVLSLAITLMLSGCTHSDVTIAPPRVPQGGRAVAIAVSLGDAKRIVVGTESGGLFRSFDGGLSFQHLDAFPTYAPMDVAIASLDPDVIIATARDDFRTVSGGGIWRSTDGGATWKRPAGWPPASGPSCPRPEARMISHMPLSRTFYVATDCGIAVSTDNGASFSMVVLDQNAPKVRAVLVINRTTGVAANDTRLFFLNGGTWQQAVGGPDSLSEFAIHAFASPWWTAEPIFYHAGRDREIYFSTDGGAHWDKMATPPHGGGREKLVRVGRGLDGDPTHFDVYFGDGFALWREAVTVSVPGGSNAWTRPKQIDHEDPADVAFTPGNEVPLMLASDGGVHLTPDSGRTWKLTGSGYGGFTALQIGEMSGRVVGGSSPHMDLYYSTQDNDIKGSNDGGHTWKGSMCCEGAIIGADAANPAHVDSKVTVRDCPGCTLVFIDPHFGDTPNPPRFPSAPDGNPANRADAPFQIVGPTYLQDVPNPGPPASFNFFLTMNAGAAWSPAFSLSSAPVGNVKFAGNLANPVAYVGVRRSGNVTGLFRIQDVTGQATVRRADSISMGSLGFLRTFQATYAVFGVDPSNPNHLIAADIVDSVMKASADGGISWFPLPALTAAVTDTGRFLFSQGMSSFATAIAWDPTNSCHILVGTMQNGVIRSADGGLTWNRVANSPVVTYVSSFFFPPTGEIWMSSYGRGLWTLSVDRRPPASGRCAFPRPPGKWPPIDPPVVLELTTHALRPFNGLRDSIVCGTCSVIAAHNGWITEIHTDAKGLKEVIINSGILAERNGTGKEVPLSVANSYATKSGEQLRRLLGTASVGTRRVRGVVLRGTEIVGLVLARDELPLPAARTPQIYIANADRSGVPSVAEVGGSVAVYGYGFLPGSGTHGVEILVGTDTAVRGVEVRADGTFSHQLTVSRGPGLLEVTATQRDGNRLTVESGSITVVAREGQR